MQFRDNHKADQKGQILDGVTIRELLLPTFVWGDDASAWGLPWETVYIDGHWIRTKLGGIDGYSSHIALAEGLKVFPHNPIGSPFAQSFFPSIAWNGSAHQQR